ncbi:FtsZ/tubulin family protein [Haloarcula sediminis]|uniref:cell division protein FtsZ n=1 Tax=Haloarcula sediminis TaxID=3111777 RepID=UPI002D77A4AE|nr:cell division protein FtsZ [Haloarcula sp. CK38]
MSNIPNENQLGIAEQHGLVERSEPGFEEKVTGGFGRNPVKADEVMSQYDGEVEAALDRRFGDTPTTDPDPDADDEEVNRAETETIDFVFLCLGLGGGTGCGIGPHLARQIKEYTDGHAKVIAIAILPNTAGSAANDSADGGGAGRQAWNANYGIDRLEEEADGIILVDNQRISHLDSSAGQFSQYNEYVAASLHDLITGPVFSGVDASDVSGVDTPDIDVRDILTSLSFGVGSGDSQPGYAAIGRSVTMTHSLGGYLLPAIGQQDIDSAALSRLSASKQTLARADSAEVQKAISLIRAPSSYLTDGKYSVEMATVQQFLEESCSLNEVNLGIALSDRRLVSLTTLLTYRREDVTRLNEIADIAANYEAEAEQLTT